MEAYMFSWIPICMFLFVILPAQNAAKKAAVLKVIREGRDEVTNEIIVKCIGKVCVMSYGTLGSNITGRIIEVKDNWVEVDTKKGKAMLNLDYVQNIKVEY